MLLLRPHLHKSRDLWEIIWWSLVTNENHAFPNRLLAAAVKSTAKPHSCRPRDRLVTSW